MTSNEIKTVGIVGAGTMGQGIAQVCALTGFEVLLFDINSAFLEKAFSGIEKSLQLSVDKNKITVTQKQHALDKIRSYSKLEALKADLIIEAASENLQVKREIFLKLESVNSPDTVLTSNTSSIPITQIASVLNKPDRFAGFHFFNPAQIMKLIEIISGAETTGGTIEILKHFSKKLGKVGVIAKDSPGFIVNRVARHYYVESLKLLEENAADLQTIDKLLKTSGFKMGAFELMDLIGVDVNFSVTTSIFNAFHNEPKFRPSRIQQQKVDAGHHGRKSGKGFYDYTSG